jgi:hypothetical protein
MTGCLRGLVSTHNVTVLSIHDGQCKSVDVKRTESAMALYHEASIPQALDTRE